jgi:hypothetical protein
LFLENSLRIVAATVFNNFSIISNNGISVVAVVLMSFKNNKKQDNKLTTVIIVPSGFVNVSRLQHYIIQ